MKNQKLPNTHRSTGKSSTKVAKIANKNNSLNQKNLPLASVGKKKGRAVNSPTFSKVASSIRKTMGYK